LVEGPTDGGRRYRTTLLKESEDSGKVTDQPHHKKHMDVGLKPVDKPDGVATIGNHFSLSEKYHGEKRERKLSLVPYGTSVVPFQFIYFKERRQER